jgi:glycerol-3-phosphate acyltransferase PlsY
VAALITAVVVGYLVGSVSPAMLVARARGVDLRSVGSGNPGATNAGRALGRKIGILIAVADVAKGAVPAAVFWGIDPTAGLIAGIAAVLGHVTSPFLRGRGGKGVATAAGAILGVHPLWALIVVLAWVVTVAVSRWVALASIVAGAVVVVVAVVAQEDIWWAAVIAVVIWVRHWENIRRRWVERRA